MPRRGRSRSSRDVDEYMKILMDTDPYDLLNEERVTMILALRTEIVRMMSAFDKLVDALEAKEIESLR